MSLTLAGAALLGSAITGVGSLIGNFFNRSTTENVNSQNIAFQRQENAITRAREDNAFQRAASDLQAAGLSKTLAAGSPASSASMTAPQVQAPPKWESVLAKLDLGQKMLDIALAKKQIEQQDANISKTNAETLGINLSNGFALEDHTMNMRQKESVIALNESNVRVNNAKAKLDEIYGEHYSEEITLRIGKLASEIDLNKISIKEAKQKIANLVQEEYGIKAKNLKILEEIAESRLRQYQMMWDLENQIAGGYDSHGPTKIFGFPLGAAISNFNRFNGTQKVFIPDSNFNWLD